MKIQIEAIAEAIVQADPSYWEKMMEAYEAYIYEKQAKYPYGDYYANPADYGFFISKNQKEFGFEISHQIAAITWSA
jgi:hypothetical protein